MESMQRSVGLRGLARPAPKRVDASQLPRQTGNGGSAPGGGAQGRRQPTPSATTRSRGGRGDSARSRRSRLQGQHKGVSQGPCSRRESAAGAQGGKPGSESMNRTADVSPPTAQRPSAAWPRGFTGRQAVPQPTHLARSTSQQGAGRGCQHQLPIFRCECGLTFWPEMSAAR